MADVTTLITALMLNSELVENIGDCPNFEFATLGGMFFWDEIDRCNGYVLQRHKISGHCRILDCEDVRVAWGNEEAMREKFKRLSRKEFLSPGDIVGVKRKSAAKIYEHFAVYIGDGQVVHYSANGGDFGGKISKEPFSSFLKNDKDYFVLHFAKGSSRPYKIQKRTEFNFDDLNVGRFLDKDFKLYSPEETVERALSRLGESDYNLLSNNCEHFAIWCKTGVAESLQVNRKFQAMYKTFMVSHGAYNLI